MTELNIYVRTDLRTNSGKKVPNGKMAAQSAHALMAGFLGLFDRTENEIVSFPENENLINSFIEGTVKINYLPIKEEQVEEIQSKSNVISIVDQGRTVFKEPTLTTMIEMPENVKLSSYIDCKSEIDERYRSKQTIVIDKEFIKDKWEMFSVVSEVSLESLLPLIMKYENTYNLMIPNEGFDNWIKGAFAKITLQPNEVTMIDLLDNLNNSNNIMYNFKSKDSNLVAIAIGADFVEEVDKFTKEGFKLV